MIAATLIGSGAHNHEILLCQFNGAAVYFVGGTTCGIVTSICTADCDGILTCTQGTEGSVVVNCTAFKGVGITGCIVAVTCYRGCIRSKAFVNIGCRGVQLIIFGVQISYETEGFSPNMRVGIRGIRQSNIVQKLLLIYCITCEDIAILIICQLDAVPKFTGGIPIHSGCGVEAATGCGTELLRFGVGDGTAGQAHNGSILC